MPPVKPFLHFILQPLIILFLFVMVLADCTPRPRRSFLPNIPGYDETQKELIILDKQLLEISGIFHVKDGVIAANNDEHGRIYFYNLNDKSIDVFKFAGKGDYEDIVVIEPVFESLVTAVRGLRRLQLHAAEKVLRETKVRIETEAKAETAALASGRTAIVLIPVLVHSNRSWI